LQIVVTIVMQICMKLTKNARDILADEIKSKQAEQAVSFAEIARITKVDPSQVGRICGGDFRTLSANVMQICTFLGVDTRAGAIASAKRSPLAEQLESAVVALWDGSPSGAQALLRLLRELAVIQKRQPRRKKSTRSSTRAATS